MDISVYTDALEGHVLHLLAQIGPVATYKKRIGCLINLSPGYPMYIEWKLDGVKPKGVGTKAWADDLHKKLRKFPCSGALKIKYDCPRSHWFDDSYNYGHSYDTNLSHTWDNLAANGGLSVYAEARIPAPAQASETVTIKLEWIYENQDGEE